MPNSTFIQVPSDLSDPIVLRRFLLVLIQQLDIAFGNRGDTATTSSLTELQATINTINTVISGLLSSSIAASTYVRQDGGTDFTGIQSYSVHPTFSVDEELIDKKYADDNFTNNPQQSDPGDLNQTISGTYNQAQVQAISDKVDTILAALRSANII